MATIGYRLVHAYFDVDYNLVWDTIEEEIPQTETGLKKLIERMSSNK